MFTWWEIIALIFVSFWCGFLIAVILNMAKERDDEQKGD